MNDHKDTGVPDCIISQMGLLFMFVIISQAYTLILNEEKHLMKRAEQLWIIQQAADYFALNLQKQCDNCNVVNILSVEKMHLADSFLYSIYFREVASDHLSNFVSQWFEQ